MTDDLTGFEESVDLGVFIRLRTL